MAVAGWYVDGAAATVTLRVYSRPAVQVGAIYRGHGPGRDSSLEVVIGPDKLDRVMSRSNRPRRT